MFIVPTNVVSGVVNKLPPAETISTDDIAARSNSHSNRQDDDAYWHTTRSYQAAFNEDLQPTASTKG